MANDDQENLHHVAKIRDKSTFTVILCLAAVVAVIAEHLFFR